MLESINESELKAEVSEASLVLRSVLELSEHSDEGWTDRKLNIKVKRCFQFGLTFDKAFVKAFTLLITSHGKGIVMTLKQIQQK